MTSKEKKARYNKEWRQRNKAKTRHYSNVRRKNETPEQRQIRLENNKAYREAHKAERKEYQKEYAKRFKEKHGVSKDQYYYSKNKAKYNQSSKAYKNRNKEKVREYEKNYRIRKINENPNFVNEQTKQKTKRVNERLKTDKLFLAKQKLRTTVRISFNRIKKNKQTNTEELLGCTWQEAKRHIESLWTEGMSWENHGSTINCWQIDHVRPVASFKEHELHEMNLISNLQPLWKKDNLSKGDKFVE